MLKVSVITACFNSEKTIEDTILSVLHQTYKNIEYIIIDGASAD
ncbi:glycosyltransferase, partial [Helicobacter pylori]